MQDSREGSTVKHITCVVELNQPLPSTFCNYLYDKPKHTTTYPLGKIQKKCAHLQMSSAGRVFASLPCIFISKRTLNQIKKTSCPTVAVQGIRRNLMCCARPQMFFDALISSSSSAFRKLSQRENDSPAGLPRAGFVFFGTCCTRGQALVVHEPQRHPTASPAPAAGSSRPLSRKIRGAGTLQQISSRTRNQARIP